MRIVCVDSVHLRSGFGLIFYLGLANVRKIACNFLSDFVSEFLPRFFRHCFSKVSAPLQNSPQNSSPKLSAFLSNFSYLSKFFSHTDFLFTRQSICFGSLPNAMCGTEFSSFKKPPFKNSNGIDAIRMFFKNLGFSQSNSGFSLLRVGFLLPVRSF